MKEFDKLLMKETRPFTDFSSKDEYLVAMVEDLSDWLNYLYNLKGDDQLNPGNFFAQLKNGVILCKHANVVQSLAEQFISTPDITNRKLPMKIGNQDLKVPSKTPSYTSVNFSSTYSIFSARDNVSNFIKWCRDFNIPVDLTFETDDLIMMKNPRHVVIALLELSRIGKLFGMEVPDIIQLEQEIDDGIEDTDNGDDGDSSDSGSDIDDIEMESVTSHDDCDGVGITDEAQYEDRDQASTAVIRSPYSLKGRRSSVNITRQDISPLFDPLEHQIIHVDAQSIEANTGEIISQNIDNGSQRMRKSQSVYFDTMGSPMTSLLDNSDNDSLFSQCSSSKFTIPKYKTKRPVGRVKIYDNFDKSNYVAVKKTREQIDLRSMDKNVREILRQCQCEEMFPLKRIKAGEYKWGDKKTKIFVRILNSHVMVRVGGGWETLANFFNKHDPCRKGKCEDFKFCLPAKKKKVSATPSAIRPLIKQSTTLPTTTGEFDQGMLTVILAPKRNSYHGTENTEASFQGHILSNDNNSTYDSVVREKISDPVVTMIHCQSHCVESSMTPVRVKKDNSNALIPIKFKSASSKDSAVKLRLPQDIKPCREKCSSLDLINSPANLAANLETMYRENYDNRGIPRPVRGTPGSTRIPVLRSVKKK